MSEAQWWLYDLVVLAVAVLCIWNGVSGGIFRAVGGLAGTVVSCLAAALIAAPVSEMVYDAFFQTRCQSLIVSNLEQIDMTEDVRNSLGQYGVYLPVSDEEIAQMIQSINEEDGLLDQTAALLGLDAEQLRSRLGEAVIDAVETQPGLLPEWAEETLSQSDKSTALDVAADIAAALFSNDYYEAAAGLEQTYLRPAILPVLKVLVFALSAFVISLLLRAVLLVLPSGRNNLLNQLLGGALGLVKTGIYLYLIVLMVSCIASMQNGAYPFFSEGTIERTWIFRILYDAFEGMR